MSSFQQASVDAIDPHSGGLLVGFDSFQRLVESLADGIVVVSPSGLVLYANQAAARVFGQPSEQLLSRPIGCPIIEDHSADIQIHVPGESPKDVEMRTARIAWRGDAALLATLRDVSAQRAAQERRHQSQKMEAVGRLAVGIVHDFNNLIAAFESGLALLERQIGTDSAGTKAGGIIDEMRARAANGSALARQLLGFSRRQVGGQILTEVNARITSMTHLLERTLGHGIRLQTNLAPDLEAVSIDANQFDVALLNLVVNARDAMSGSGTLTIETKESEYRNERSDTGSFICVSVTDTGTGMGNEILAQVFEPFFTTKDEGLGTGLGLSQVYGFAHQSGGHVQIDSEVGRGTTVRLFLPRRAGTPD